MRNYISTEKNQISRKCAWYNSHDQHWCWFTSVLWYTWISKNTLFAKKNCIKSTVCSLEHIGLKSRYVWPRWYSPSKLNMHELTSPWWPLRTWTHSPVLPSHSLESWSKDPVIIRLPPVSKPRLTISPTCPISRAVSFPISTSHNRAVLSMEPVQTIVLEGLNDKHTISLSCPLKVCKQSPESAHQILQVLSKDPVAILFP